MTPDNAEGTDERESVERKPSSSGLARGATAIGVLFSVYHILYIAFFFERLGIYISSLSHRAISLCFILVLIFLLHRFKKKLPASQVPWYDWILIVLSIIVCAYIVAYYELNWLAPGAHPLSAQPREMLETVLGLITLLLVLESTRRVLGLALPIVAICFISYALFGNHVPILFLQCRGYSLSRLTHHLYVWSEGIWGVAMDVAATVIVAFIIFAALLRVLGAGDFFVNIAFSLFGRMRGGPAKAAVIASAAMGTISGSTTANVMGTGVFTIPLMKRVGYRPDFAGAVEAVSSNGGQIMPPVMGAVAFIISEIAGIPYGKIVISATIPALLYFFAVFVMVDFEAAKVGLKGLPGSDLPSVRKTMKEGWLYLAPLLTLVVLLIGLMYSPERSALLAAAALIIISLFSQKPRGSMVVPKKVVNGLDEGARGMLVVTSACAAAGIIIGCVSLTGLGAKMSMIATDIAHGNMFILLLLAAFACFILGMGMSSIPCYLMVAVIVAPNLVMSGMLPIAAHLFVFWWALTSFITPPVAIAAYAAAGIAGGNPFRTGFEAVRLGVLTFILPFMFVYQPVLLMIGSPGEIVYAVVTAIAGTLAFAAGLQGYLLRKAGLWERILLGVGGIGLIIPGLNSDLLGLILLAPVIVLQVKAMKAAPAPKDESPGESHGM